ncbi:MAG: hypothetical protein HWN80_18945 [Candidatus Lokiarchaeota archaeon]|nr:hypothetical protein [Candidatus Lokiarchaeota archaeon]
MSFPKVEVRRGLAGLLWKQMEPVNNVDKFKELYKDKSLSILYKLTDQPYAALIKVENGKLDIKHLKNEEEAFNNLQVDASMACPTELFFDFSSGSLSKFGALTKMLTGKLKIKGMDKMKELGEIMALL